jgi:membrane protease YdiL (CAAX protease family)
MATLRLSRRLSLFVLFLLGGLLVFVAPQFLQNAIQVIAQVCIAVAFLVFGVWLRLREPASSYFPVTFAFFIGAFVMLLESLLEFLGLVSLSTVYGMFSWQIMSTLAIVIPIIMLTKISGTDMGGIYLQRGRLRLGLLIGLGPFLFMLILILGFPAGLRYASMLFSISEDITYEKLLSLMPIVVAFVLLNGFKEELLNRGIFLKKFEPFLGARPSNILTAFVFAVTHVGVDYTPVLLVFLGITFLLGLAWGYVMQKTDSIIGSALFHGAMDITIILGIFSYL